MFIVQLALNAAWSPVFFLLHWPLAALVIIVLLAISIAATIGLALRAQRTAAWLLLPYFAWACYATTLNAGIVVLNP